MKLRRDRLPVIIAWLGQGRSLMAQTLAWRLDVSIRTVHRDIAYLRQHGHRIDSSAGRGGGLILRNKKEWKHVA